MWLPEGREVVSGTHCGGLSPATRSFSSFAGRSFQVRSHKRHVQGYQATGSYSKPGSEVQFGSRGTVGPTVPSSGLTFLGSKMANEESFPAR